MDVNSLAHTKWNCKYHVVFAPKFRRKIIYNELRQDIGKIIRMLCERKRITIIEAELSRSHAYADKYTTKNECGRSNRIYQR